MVKTNGERATFMPAIMRVLIAVLFLVIFAGIFTWYIFWQQYGQNTETVLTFIREKSTLAGYSYALVLVIMCLVAAITWRPFLTIGISFALSGIMMYIHGQKMLFRASPLLPEDFLMVDQAGVIMRFINMESVTKLVVGAALVIIGSGILEYGARRIFGPWSKEKAWWERHSIIPRVAWTLVTLTGLVLLAHPILHFDDKEDESGNWISDLEFEYCNQKENYRLNGFILAFLYSLEQTQEPEPEGYSAEAIAKIIEKYTDDASQKYRYASLADVADNIIIVLDESFMDPEIMAGLYQHTGGDVVPNLHKLFQKYPSGYMFSPGYGGGTANIEFEVVTGLSNYWAQTSPYVTALSKMDNIPGIVDIASKAGYQSTAIHPYDGSMYKRGAVYGRMGIKTFLEQHTMTHTKHENNGGYVSDQETYAEVLDVLKAGNDKRLVLVATMQNHMPYDAAKYDVFNYKLVNEIMDPYSYESYLETVNRADKYLGEFVAELDKLEERTVMLWFGDHTPALLGEYIESGDDELSDLAHLTPWFIYANFELDELYSEKQVAKMNKALGFELKTKGVNLPIVTPNCLTSILYQTLDVKMPTLMKLTSAVCAETPILSAAYSRIGDMVEGPVLQDYRLVNYDILSGKRYWTSSI